LQAEDEDSDEDGYDARHLAGLKVTHGLEKVMDGGAIVLTLKDTSILDEKGNEVNEATDELENVEIIEQKRRDDARKAAKKGPNVWSDKFDNDGEGARTILPQYDDSKEQEEGVTLDSEGGLDLKSKQRMEEIQRKLSGAAAADQGKQSLLGSGQRVAADYFTQEEMERFKKPKDRKKKKLRKREKLDLDAMEEEAKAAGLGAGDRGSRANRDQEEIAKVGGSP
jgi:U4/U6.U5 tri-snRNP-associated protein 1